MRKIFIVLILFISGFGFCQSNDTLEIEDVMDRLDKLESNYGKLKSDYKLLDNEFVNLKFNMEKARKYWSAGSTCQWIGLGLAILTPLIAVTFSQEIENSTPIYDKNGKQTGKNYSTYNDYSNCYVAAGVGGGVSFLMFIIGTATKDNAFKLLSTEIEKKKK